MMKCRLTRRADNIERMERGEAFTKFYWGKLRERGQLVDSGVDGRIVLMIFKKWYMALWIGSY